MIVDFYTLLAGVQFVCSGNIFTVQSVNIELVQLLVGWLEGAITFDDFLAAAGSSMSPDVLTVLNNANEACNVGV